MEDASVAILEALAMWNYSVQEGVIEGKGGDGSQEPTVPWDEKDPHQVYSTRLHPVSAILGRTWDSPGTVPLNLQKRPRNLGKPAPAPRARACSGLQEGEAEAAGRNRHRELPRKKRSESPKAYPARPGRCPCGWLHPQ